MSHTDAIGHKVTFAPGQNLTGWVEDVTNSEPFILQVRSREFGVAESKVKHWLVPWTAVLCVELGA